MATIQRANVILQVPDEPDIIQKYKDQGFNVIDNATGKILERAVPHEEGALRALVQDLKKELEEKEKEIAELKKELSVKSKPKTGRKQVIKTIQQE